MDLDLEGSLRDGYVAIRGAFDPHAASACRQAIWIMTPHGEAGTLADTDLWRPSVLCRPVVHATGQAGDVYLCHPFIVHTATWPHRGTTARMIAQPAIHVRDGFTLDGTDPSPVARAIVTGLTVNAEH